MYVDFAFNWASVGPLGGSVASLAASLAFSTSTLLAAIRTTTVALSALATARNTTYAGAYVAAAWGTTYVWAYLAAAWGSTSAWAYILTWKSPIVAGNASRAGQIPTAQNVAKCRACCFLSCSMD